MNWQEKFDNRKNYYIPEPFVDLQILFDLNMTPDQAFSEGLITPDEYDAIQRYTNFMLENRATSVFKSDLN